MKKTFLFMAFLFLVIAILISSCKYDGVLVSESTGEHGKIIPDSTNNLGLIVQQDQINKFRIVGTDGAGETKTITIQITGSAEKIDMLTEAAKGKYEIRYVLKRRPIQELK
ncbi:MAG: hypothetical protein WCI92_00910 [Bacteroidota bacterium]